MRVEHGERMPDGSRFTFVVSEQLPSSTIADLAPYLDAGGRVTRRAWQGRKGAKAPWVAKVVGRGGHFVDHDSGTYQALQPKSWLAVRDSAGNFHQWVPNQSDLDAKDWVPL